ncbi:MAG TPA: M1 family aminopeptidase [Steroidobacteraceae bacterium]|nr:M1 family aminopeptidase [Steroidobacteraceae bacterium]
MRRKTVQGIYLLLLAAVAPHAGAEAPFNFDSAPGRLPKDVVPLSYEVAVVPSVAASSIAGRESVKLQFRKSTATLEFNSLHETLSHVRFDGKPVKNVVSSDDRQLTTVTLSHPAAEGSHTLSFSYTGKIETQPHGLFAQKYTGVDGKPDVMLSTQMEATDARRMFPCWDEPAFRAVFDLTVTVPADWATVSNMPIERRTVTGNLATVKFRASPKMPSYLVEFTGGHLREVSARVGPTDFGVWAVAGHEQDGKTALANAEEILGDYNEYFGYPYPLPKLDSIAVPGGFSGAMENWGAITYNDQLLLLSPSSTLSNRQEVFSVQAHEMAHQWSGDLVTMGWWDDIWLNESFASWRAAKETAIRNPTWKWWEQEDVSKERAMSADARSTSHAIEQHVTDELQADNSFDPDITYNKGQAFLRMLEAYLSDDTFRDGIRRYIKARAYSNATSADLWNALSAASGKDISQIASGWTEQPGFPLVSVAARCDADGQRTLVMTQKRFLLTGSGPGASSWRVPLEVRSGTAGKPQPVLMSDDEAKVPAGRCNEALSVNADAIGYFRAQYDEATLATNTRQFASIPDGDRIALLDDQWALVESGEAPLKTFLALASAMDGNTDTRAWQQIVGALGTIEYAERGSPGHQAFESYARTVIKPVADKLGWNERADEAPDARELRITLLGDLGRWGDEATIREASRRFEAFVKDRNTLGPDQQSTVLGIVAEYANAATFDELHTIAKQAKDETERERYYLALASVRDPKLALEVAQIALSDELPPEAASLRLQMMLALAAEHKRLSWDTFTANEKRLLEAVPSEGPLILAQIVPSVYWDAVPLDQLESWVRGHVPAEMSDAVARGMETARFKLKEKNALVAAADAYVNAASAARSK